MEDEDRMLLLFLEEEISSKPLPVLCQDAEY